MAILTKNRLYCAEWNLKWSKLDHRCVYCLLSGLFKSVCILCCLSSCFECCVDAVKWHNCLFQNKFSKEEKRNRPRIDQALRELSFWFCSFFVFLFVLYYAVLCFSHSTNNCKKIYLCNDFPLFSVVVCCYSWYGLIWLQLHYLPSPSLPFKKHFVVYPSDWLPGSPGRDTKSHCNHRIISRQRKSQSTHIQNR